MSHALHRSFSALALALALWGCGGGTVDAPDSGSTVPDSGPYVTPVDTDDAGPVFKDPNVAQSFGPFTGKFDVNGGGQLFALQVDGHLALHATEADQVFFGHIDGGAFATETLFPELEDCGPVTFEGHYFADGGYAGTEQFCANGQAVSGPWAGARFVSPHIYRQDLFWSGAYDANEVADTGNGCAQVTGNHRVVLGVARDLDGGPATVALFGDGLQEQFVYGAVDDDTGLLSARAQDAQGNPTDSFQFGFLADGGIGGTRQVQLEGASGPCTAALKFFGSKR